MGNRFAHQKNYVYTFKSNKASLPYPYIHVVVKKAFPITRTDSFDRSIRREYNFLST
jgi:hypothetical protein